jgi:hypothetical protein
MQTCKVRDLIDIVIYYNGIKITEYHWKAKYQLLKEKKHRKCAMATIFLYFIFKLRLMEIFLGILKIFLASA